jgi:hypothetical protein
LSDSKLLPKTAPALREKKFRRFMNCNLGSWPREAQDRFCARVVKDYIFSYSSVLDPLEAFELHLISLSADSVVAYVIHYKEDSYACLLSHSSRADCIFVFYRCLFAGHAIEANAADR